MYWTSGCGRIELNITKRQANAGYHPGDCDADVQALAAEPAIRRQMAKLDPDIVRDELREYGAWDAAELADDAMNLRRLLWLACADIVDNH